MRMRVDETGHDHSTAGVNDFAIGVNQGLDLAARARLNDAPVANEHRAIFDARRFAHFCPDARATRPGQRDELGSPDYGKRFIHHTFSFSPTTRKRTKASTKPSPSLSRRPR